MKNPFKRAIQAILRRIFGPLFFGLAIAALTTACAATFRTVGQHDPTVEAIKALTEVLKAPAVAPVAVTPAGMLTCDCWDPGCPSPPTGPEMTPSLLSYLSDADIRRCQRNAVKRLSTPEGGR